MDKDTLCLYMFTRYSTDGKYEIAILPATTLLSISIYLYSEKQLVHFIHLSVKLHSRRCEMFQAVSSIPLHTQAANYIRDKIYNREWEVGGRIPTEYKLCEELGMSRGSVKRGIRTLVDEGLLIQYRGKGTFVANRNTITHPSGNTLLSFAESLKAQNIDFATKVIGCEIIPADFFLSEKLFIAVGDPVLLLKRVRFVDGEPIMYIDSR